MTKTVYMAGPISNLSYDGAVDWRKEFAAMMPDDVIALSPMRGKDYLKGDPKLHMDGYEKKPLSTAKAITARDRHDCFTADAIVFNFLGATERSVGTCIELGWADAQRKLAILVMENSATHRNVHEHAMVREICGYHVTSLEMAARLTEALLSMDYARQHQ